MSPAAPETTACEDTAPVPPVQAAACEPATLRSVVHVSSAAAPMSEDALEALLAEFRELNAECGTTGVLLYSDGCFMQCIEGDAAGVQAARERVRDSGIHRDIFELLDEAIPRRCFSEGQLGILGPTRSALLNSSTAAWLHTLNGDPRQESDGLALLRQFWKNAR